MFLEVCGGPAILRISYSRPFILVDKITGVVPSPFGLGYPHTLLLRRSFASRIRKALRLKSTGGLLHP
uniref:Uncharacterized protein n=1 Tax=Cannabis sativa TaxID=3483 RepID=A0A803PAY6_CANSA